MRTLIRFAVLLLVTVSLMSASVPAQKYKDKLGARGIRTEYEEKKSDGMRVWVYKVEGNKCVDDAPVTRVSSSHVFAAGDRAKIEFESNFDGYVYVINVEPTGKKRVLFPHASIANANHKVQADKRYFVPTGGCFWFDEQKGEEIIQVIMLRQPIGYLDEAVKNSEGELGETASNAAAELAENAPKQAGVEHKDQTKTPPPASANSGLRGRDFKLEPGKDNPEKVTTVIAIPDDKPKAKDASKDGKLKGGDYVVLNLRLQHN